MIYEMEMVIRKMIFLLLAFVSLSGAATVVDPSDCTVFPCLILDDEFDFLDYSVWEHEVTLGGGGNWEFQGYINNRSITYTRDSTLFIKPDLTSNWAGTEDFLSTGTWSVWGSQGRNDVCTGNFFYGCERIGNAVNIINPIMSGRLRTLHQFSFRYGRVDIVAKPPRGDWMWSALWMMPENHKYGLWPASGEIDIMESRGNEPEGTIGNDYFGQTLHWGPYFALNSYWRTTHEVTTTDGTALPDDFHTYSVEWDDQSIRYYFDDVLTTTMDPGTSFWDFGEFANVGDIDNPWSEGGKMTPFDQNFYIIMNVAVGGTNGYFPDESFASKPWTNDSPQAFLDFWNARDDWYPTWQQGGPRTSEGAAFQIDSVKVYKMVSTEM